VEDYDKDTQLYALINVDTSEDAQESIAELTALLNKGATVTVDKTPAGNEPCTCGSGSGKKYKKCCGQATPSQQVNHYASNES
jgi:SWIM/SEC-C metal-binding protein